MTTSNAPRPIAVVVLAAGKGTRLPGVGPQGARRVPRRAAARARRARRRAAPPEGERGRRRPRPRGRRRPGSRRAGPRRASRSRSRRTARATRRAWPSPRSRDFRGDVLVVCADVPQVTTDDLVELLAAHRRSDAAATVLVGESRRRRAGSVAIVRGAAGRVERIVEARDATPAQTAHPRVQHGHLRLRRGARSAPRWSVLPKTNAQGEEYLTDAIGALSQSGGRVARRAARRTAPRCSASTRRSTSPRPSPRSACASVGAHLAAGVQIVDPAIHGHRGGRPDRARGPHPALHLHRSTAAAIGAGCDRRARSRTCAAAPCSTRARRSATSSR